MSLECPVCLLEFRITTKYSFLACSKLICNKCLRTLAHCPFCWAPISGHILRGEFAEWIQERQGNALVACEDCKHSFPFKEYHLCHVKKVKCTYCFAFFSENDFIRYHSQCPEQQIECDLCSLMVRRGLLQTHLEERCSGKCPHCDWTVTGCDYNHHVETECSQSYMQCPEFPTCKAQFKRYQTHTCPQVEEQPFPLALGIVADVATLVGGQYMWLRARIIIVEWEYVCVRYQEMVRPIEWIPVTEAYRFVSPGYISSWGPTLGKVVHFPYGQTDLDATIIGLSEPYLDVLKEEKVFTWFFDDGARGDYFELSKQYGWMNETRWHLFGIRNRSQFLPGMFCSVSRYESQNPLKHSSVLVQIDGRTESEWTLRLVKDARNLETNYRCLLLVNEPVIKETAILSNDPFAFLYPIYLEAIRGSGSFDFLPTATESMEFKSSVYE